MSLAAMPFSRPLMITGLRASGPTAIRMMEMGLIAGARVEVLGRAPLGDPLRIRVDDSEFSLRSADAELIDVAAMS